MLPRAHFPSAALLGFSSLLLAAYQLACGRVEVEQRPTAEVGYERIESIVVATGTIEPAKEVEVRSRIAGIVERIQVDDGDEVEAGQVLLELERELLESQLREAQAMVRAAKVERRYARIELQRAEELVESGARSPQFLDRARARFEGADADVARSLAREGTLGTQLGYATVRAQLAGRVLEVHTEEGNAVSPVTAVTGGTLLISLAATERLHLEGLVDENEVALLEIGQRARIRTEAFADRIFEGRVREVAPMGKRIQNVTYFEVEIDLVAEDARLLRPRMSGDADIVIRVVEEALVIPETALHYHGDEIYVETSNGAGEPERRDIEIGIVDGSKIQVLEGIEAGEIVYLQ